MINQNISKYLIIFMLLLHKYSYSQNLIKPLLTKENIVIDGVLDEQVWIQSNFISDFKTYIPDFGKALKDSTYAAIAYDQENIYIAFKCIDSEPDKIKATMAARDQIGGDDWVCISLDSKNEQQGINSFVVNPKGVQYDSYSSATSEDIGVDLVWFSAGKLTGKGYNVEIKIPLKSLRYSNKLPVEMGILLERKISRYSTNATFPSLDPNQGYAYFNQLAKIELDSIKQYHLFEVLPALTYSYHQTRVDNSLKEDLNKPDLSLNLKYGITSALILDATVNPDFSQVEADAGQVDINLRTQLYYPEKRPFFLEGNDKYAIAATSSSVVDPIYYMVYTRTIVNPVTGIKLTGNFDKKNAIALLYSVDEVDNPIENSKTYAHFPIVRYKYNFLNDNYVGLTYTGRQDNSSGNQTYGIDGQSRINKSTMLEYNAFNTNTQDTSSHRNGYTYGLTLSSSKRNYDYVLTQKDIAKDFNAATGYYSRTGISQFSGLLRPKIYSDSSTIRRVDFEVFSSFTYDKFYNSWESFNHASALFYLGNTSQMKVKYSFSKEIYLGKSFNTSGAHVLLTGRIGNWLSASILYRRVNAIYYSSDPFGGLSNRVTSSLVLNPFSKLYIGYSYIFTDFAKKGESKKLYDYQIDRLKVTYQLNKYLFLRCIEEYNSYYKTLLSDFLVSFTYIPGTVFHVGYGTIFQQEDTTQPFFRTNIKPVEEERGFFFKFSYLFRR